MIELFGALDGAAGWAELLLAVGALIFLVRGWGLTAKQTRRVVGFLLVSAACVTVDHRISAYLSRPEVIENYLTQRQPVFEVLIIAARGGYALTIWLLVLYGFGWIVPGNVGRKNTPPN